MIDIGSTTTHQVLILFVTGDAPRSRRARDNLARGLDLIGCRRELVQEIDLIETPARAVEEGIFATPALLRRGRHDGDSAILYGDLSDETQLHRFLADIAPDDEHAG